MRIGLLSLAAAALLSVLAFQSIRPQTALAAFHIAQINEVMVGFDGDPTVQYVEIRQFGGQIFVTGTQLAAFGPTGNFIGVILTVPNDVPNNPTWIMGTPSFEAESGIQADFEIAPMLPPGGGMVCWGATSGANMPNNHVDCVAYGNYTGPVIPSPPTETLGPGDCQRSLTRTVNATFPGPNPPTHTYAYGNNLNDFTLATPSPTNGSNASSTMPNGTDLDLDLLFNCRDTDDDGDAALDVTDNCPLIANPGQADADSDFAGDPCDPNSADPDSDDDTCLDGRELSVNHVNGGERDPLDFWDFFDLNGDLTIDLTDAIDVLGYFGDAGTSVDGNLRDRDSLNMAQPWRTSEGNDGVDLTDAINNLSSFGDSC